MTLNEKVVKIGEFLDSHGFYTKGLSRNAFEILKMYSDDVIPGAFYPASAFVKDSYLVLKVSPNSETMSEMNMIITCIKKGKLNSSTMHFSNYNKFREHIIKNGTVE